MTANRSQTCTDCGDPYAAAGLLARCAARHQTGLAPLTLEHVTATLDPGVAGGVSITVARGHARLSRAEALELGLWLQVASEKRLERTATNADH